ncbi:MAG: DUF732 domain-containing protein [Mycobacterium sp.]|nr:DUF732 domain-containing protein [Mycobacterium sp.]
MRFFGRLFTVAAVPAAAAAVVTAVPAHADPDIDFANELHSYGIYGQRDYNAWLGKIACKRLDRGVDPDAYASEAFVARNLARDTTQTQAWQFLGAAISIYCPGNIAVLQNAAR